jgi:hypothetical protein
LRPAGEATSEGSLLHELRIIATSFIGHPSYGLPWGQDRLIPIFLATQAIRQKSPQIVFESAAEMLSTFGMHQGGSQYQRLVASFQRIFGATIFFGTDFQSERAVVVHRATIQFHDGSSNLVFPRPRAKSAAGRLPEQDHSERKVLRRDSGPSDSETWGPQERSSALDLFMWPCYRCFTARGKERLPLFRAFGRVSQLGSIEYVRPASSGRSSKGG